MRGVNEFGSLNTCVEDSCQDVSKAGNLQNVTVEVVSCICFENSKSGLVERALFRKLGRIPHERHQCTKRAGYISSFYMFRSTNAKGSRNPKLFSLFCWIYDPRIPREDSAKQMCWIHWNTEKKGSFLGIPAFRKILPPLAEPQ